MSAHSMSSHPPSTQGTLPLSLWSRTLRRLAAMAALRRHHKALAQLDRRLLHDIGLTSEEAQAELARPIWDVPQHWRG